MRLRRLSGIKEHGSGGTHRVAGAGLGLQHGAAAALDFVCAGREPDEEGIDVRADVGRSAAAGVGGDSVRTQSQMCSAALKAGL